jgi:hypothetical protein
VRESPIDVAAKTNGQVDGSEHPALQQRGVSLDV